MPALRARRRRYKMNISIPQNSHYGARSMRWRPISRSAPAGRYKIAEFLCQRARRRARGDRGGAARHARPRHDVDRPAPELRAGGGDLRHPVPVPRLRSCACGARRPDRAGHAEKFDSKGLKALAWGENGFRHMTNNKHAVNGAGGPEGPEDAHDGEPDPHPGLQGLRHHPDADGVHRGVHRAAAGHGRRPGESDLRHPVAGSSTRCRSTCPSPATSIRRR